MTAVSLALSLCLLGCGEATLSVLDEGTEEVVAPEASVSSELSAARPLLSRGLGIVSREAWGARPAGTCRRGQVPNRVIVHHVGGAVANPRGWLSWYDREVRVNRGWCDLMYHFGIDEQGVVARDEQSLLLAVDSDRVYRRIGLCAEFCHDNAQGHRQGQ